MEDVEALFRFDVESGGACRVFGVSFLLSGLLLPFEYASPILSLLFIELVIELVIPLCFGLGAVFADMAALVAASAVAALDIVVQLALGLGSYLVAIDYSFKVGPFQTVR